MNTIVTGEGRMAWYTDLRAVFRAFGGRQREFDFLVTDLDFNFLGPDDVPMLPLRRVQWVSGLRLSRIVEEQFIQFVWGVFSAFPRGTFLDYDDLDALPFAHGNEMFWSDRPAVQHPDAVFELVCWGGEATMLLSRDDELSRLFRAGFPEAVDLAAHARLGGGSDSRTRSS